MHLRINLTINPKNLGEIQTPTSGSFCRAGLLPRSLCTLRCVSAYASSKKATKYYQTVEEKREKNGRKKSVLVLLPTTERMTIPE
jgi:hypothetical protein